MLGSAIGGTAASDEYGDAEDEASTALDDSVQAEGAREVNQIVLDE